MVLKAELKSINNMLTYPPFPTVKMREGAVYCLGDSIVYGFVAAAGPWM